MENILERFRKELKELIAEGERLRIRMALDLDLVDRKTREKIKPEDLPKFNETYDRWYSLSLQVLKQVLPDRVLDFVRQYRDDKRKDINYLTYGLADYMLGLQTSSAGRVVADQKAAFPKFEQQLNMLKSAEARLDSSLSDMLEVVQAHLFDDELEAARELNAKGFYRGAGAIAGVVLERHLGNVCKKRSLRPRKKNPSINDLNQQLKDEGIIDVPTWRFIQHLGDLRNLCDHNGPKEPTKEDVEDLIAGTSKIIKTLMG